MAQQQQQRRQRPEGPDKPKLEMQSDTRGQKLAADALALVMKPKRGADGQPTGEYRNLLAEILPEPFRPMADRMIKRAIFYIANKRDIWDCSAKSVADAILAAGELGLCLDGKLTHAVRYVLNINPDKRGTPIWSPQVKMMTDYKGLLAVSRRHGIIVDALCKHVYSNDVFEYSNINGVEHQRYVPNLDNRGEYRGTFCVLIFEGQRINCEYMTLDEIEHIRSKSKAKDDGPWVTDTMEMRRKTVFRRVLKTYIDDPEVLALLDAEDEADVLDTIAQEVQPSTGLTRTQQMQEAMSRSRGLPAPREDAQDFASMVGAGDSREYEEAPRRRQQQQEEPRYQEEEHPAPGSGARDEGPREQESEGAEGRTALGAGEFDDYRRDDDHREPKRERPTSSFQSARNRMVAAKSQQDMLAIYDAERPGLNEDDQAKLDDHKERLLKSFANRSTEQRSLPGAE